MRLKAGEKGKLWQSLFLICIQKTKGVSALLGCFMPFQKTYPHFTLLISNWLGIKDSSITFLTIGNNKCFGVGGYRRTDLHEIVCTHRQAVKEDTYYYHKGSITPINQVSCILQIRLVYFFTSCKNPWG